MFFLVLEAGVLVLAQESSSLDRDDSVLHFSHPLISESPSPDTEVRLDYIFQSEPEKDGEPESNRHTLRLKAEYAFTPWLSLELDFPYTFLDREDGENTHRLDNIGVGLKCANFAFSRYGVLLGGGLELEIPTGSYSENIGSDNVFVVEPFFDLGYMYRNWEVVGVTSFGVPLNENGEDEADLELGWNLSVFYHVIPGLRALAELGGEHVFGGEEEGTDVVNLTPGIEIGPLFDTNFQLGFGVSLPLTDHDEFNFKTILSLSYHIH